VDPIFFPYIILFLGFSVSAIFVGLSIFSLAAPKDFVNWFSPYAWLSTKLKIQNFDHRFAMTCAFIFLASLTLIQFMLGGIVITMLFRLQLSPFAMFL
jgi:hypothetical protein